MYNFVEFPKILFLYIWLYIPIFFLILVWPNVFQVNQSESDYFKTDS